MESNNQKTKLCSYTDKQSKCTITNDRLSEKELASIKTGLAALQKNTISFKLLGSFIKWLERNEKETPASQAFENIKTFLSDDASGESSSHYRGDKLNELSESPSWLDTIEEEKIALPVEMEADSPDYDLALICYSMRFLEIDSNISSIWLVGMSEDFIKSIQKIDKKLSGRVLHAMTHICRTPITPKGDTIKPLSSDLKGLWRYRIGDFRIIYKPDAAKRQITLLSLNARGNVYP